MKRLILPALVFAITVAVLVTPILNEPQFMDENYYLWSGDYFLHRLVSLDFNAAPGPWLDPHWNPAHWWSVSAPLPFRLLYGAGLAVTTSPAPAVPFDYDHRFDPQPLAAIPPRSLLVARLIASLCSAFGLAALAWRFGWRGSASALLILSMPLVPRDLSRAMAEGPLVGALGLAVLTFGSPWFILAAALAVGCKLTALPLFTLLLWPRATGLRGWRFAIALPAAALLWSALNPASWFAGGPLYLLPMLARRQVEQVVHNQMAGGFYLTNWYLVPFFYLLAVLLPILLGEYLRLRRVRLATPQTPSRWRLPGRLPSLRSPVPDR